MKRTIILLLTLALCWSLCGCGGEVPRETAARQDTAARPETHHKIGETVSTDIVAFTLNEARLAVALGSMCDQDYCAPKEYNLEEDLNNPFVCPKGKTYATFTYTLRNLDRVAFHGKLPLVSAEYKHVKSSKQVDAAEYVAGSDSWRTTGNNPVTPVYDWKFDLDVGEERTWRSFIQIAVEADKLSDDFYLLIELPRSDGSTTVFSYLVS